MTVPERDSLPKDTVTSELDELKQEQLLKLIIVLPSLTWVYYMLGEIISRPVWPLQADGAPFFLVTMLTPIGAYWLRHRHYRVASWFLLLGMTLSIGLIVVARPSSLTVAFMSVVIPTACTLLGTQQALLATCLVWLATIAALRIGTDGILPDVRQLSDAFLVYGLVFAVTWIGHSPLETAVSWALSAWEDVHKALLEARERRATIYRVARSLEEATYRIERMNNELIVARQIAETTKANKEHFVATVSHELRGPLNLILGFSRLMMLSPERYQVPLPNAYRADLHTIYINSQHLASLVDDILDLSRIEVAALPLVKDRIDLEDVVKEAAETVRPLAERKGLYFSVELAGGLTPILADRIRLRQVVINLLTNAVRFTEQGGITIRTAQDDGSLLVSVQDTGCGITSEDMSRLFEEFHRVQMAETTDVAGTGLGLAISKYLIELHGGQIWAESRLKVGTIFHFSLPLPDAESVAHGTMRTGKQARDFRPHETCLIVHHDPAGVRLLARHFDGYRAMGILNEQQVLPLVEELHPRAIVTTPDLVESIWFRLCQTPFDVPVISCSLPDTMQKAHDNGVLAYLTKPITAEMIEATMAQLGHDRELTVMIVDDDPDAVRLLEIMLTSSSRPCTILKAYDGLQALELMEGVVPDIVLIDLVMPGMDGEHTITRMRADQQLREVPVVIISAKDSSDDAVSLGMPLQVWGRRPLEIGKGIKLLKAILDELSPDYLSD